MKTENTLIRIMEGTSPKTGEDFFAALVKNLSLSMDMAAAWVTEYAQDFKKLRSLAFWFDGQASKFGLLVRWPIYRGHRQFGQRNPV